MSEMLSVGDGKHPSVPPQTNWPSGFFNFWAYSGGQFLVSGLHTTSPRIDCVLMELLIQYALQFVGTPYRWGGKTPAGLDCSGLIQEILSSVGLDVPGDQTAQAYYYIFSKSGVMCQAKTGALVFYGRGEHDITHIAMLLDSSRTIEAGGGDQTVINDLEALQKRAYVRIRPISHRSDVVAVIMPPYPYWISP